MHGSCTVAGVWRKPPGSLQKQYGMRQSAFRFELLYRHWEMFRVSGWSKGERGQRFIETEDVDARSPNSGGEDKKSAP